jgi:hypothetical protein
MTNAPSNGRTSFPFPHPELTKIQGKPTAITVKLLQKEVYANTRAVHCTRGGGTNGYLGIAMTDATYAIRVPGHPFIAPDHPGEQPAHALNATAAQITGVNRQYDAELDDFRQYERVREAIRQQILIAVDATYHDVLSNDDFGYADVTIVALLQHLHTQYAALTADDLEENRDKLAQAWTPDEPIENLWLRIKHIKAIASAGTEPLTDSTVLRLTLTALEKAGVYDHPIQMWRDKPDNDRTWANFVPHVERGEKERQRLLTAATAGYHGANAAVTPEVTPIAAAATTSTRFQYNTCQLFYCWTHGLNRNPNHDSTSCTSKSSGHKDDATLDNRKGGSARITFGDRSATQQTRRRVNFSEG